MDFDDLLRLCKLYQKLGWAVQEQLEDFLDGEKELSELNPNAVAEFSKFLNRADKALTDADAEDSELVMYIDEIDAWKEEKAKSQA